MHILTKNYKGNFEILHALIELACDNELRILLNKKGKYFQEGKFSVGHNTLNEIKKKALPYWYKYLKTKKKGGGEDSILTLSKKLDKINLV